jgi:hypothetical protein
MRVLPTWAGLFILGTCTMLMFAMPFLIADFIRVLREHRERREDRRGFEVVQRHAD